MTTIPQLAAGNPLLLAALTQGRAPAARSSNGFP
jgi:hypothetical protein